MISLAKVRFGLEELAGIAPGVRGKGKYNENCMIEKLMESFNKDDLMHRDIEYNEQDIVDLVEYLGMQSYDMRESIKVGHYTGNLITDLTEKNEKLGKRTIIEIPENRLDDLGNGCQKFDVVKIGINYGVDVFSGAKKGKLLYVERCEGRGFAREAGAYEGHIGAIVGVDIIGADFAERAGSHEGDVGSIVGVNVKGADFAERAGGDHGKIEAIFGLNISGPYFAYYASYENGKVGNVVGVNVTGKCFTDDTDGDGGRIVKSLKNTYRADIEYNRIIEELNKEHNLNLEKVQVRPKREWEW